VDKRILIRLAIPGGVGALLGATFLSNIDLSGGKIFISTILLLLGFLLLYRNLFVQVQQVSVADISNPKYLTFLGFSGGFIDASGGGGWGPVVTPTLLATTQTEPRKVTLAVFESTPLDASTIETARVRNAEMESMPLAVAVTVEL
jgi:uncharacterized membrane protein YfcA